MRAEQGGGLSGIGDRPCAWQQLGGGGYFETAAQQSVGNICQPRTGSHKKNSISGCAWHQKCAIIMYYNIDITLFLP